MRLPVSQTAPMMHKLILGVCLALLSSFALALDNPATSDVICTQQVLGITAIAHPHRQLRNQPCTYQVSVRRSSAPRQCALTPAEVQNLIFQDPTCLMQEGDLVRGTVFKTKASNWLED